ncbi:MAG: PhzF family phenazine biosynthesis protein [Caulobacterales bacterium]
MTRFVTLDVFTDRRFGGNPLAVFPEADGLSSEEMQALAREFNMSEVAYVQTPEDSANTARVRIFTPEMEIGFAGHPNVGVGWLLAQEGRDRNSILRFEEAAGLVEVEVERRAGAVVSCLVAAPQALSEGQTPTHDEIAACASLQVADIGAAALASVALNTVCAQVSASALARAKCDPVAFQRLAERRPDLAKICLLFLYCRDGDSVRARMFAPLSGSIEDPATGSAAAALTAYLLKQSDNAQLTLSFLQGVEMGRPSRFKATAKRIDGDIKAWVGGGCVPILKGELL